MFGLRKRRYVLRKLLNSFPELADIGHCLNVLHDLLFAGIRLQTLGRQHTPRTLVSQQSNARHEEILVDPGALLRDGPVLLRIA